MKHVTLVEVITAASSLGEGVQWNADEGCAWWTDIHARRLHRWHLGTGRGAVFAVPERVGSFAFIAGSDQLITAFETGIARYSLSGGAPIWIARPERDGSGRRFNDGRADRQGRFWAGTMVEDVERAAPASAGLYCVDGNGALSQPLDGIQIANGLCFSPDSRRCYFTDSPRRLIYRFDFDADTGRLGTRHVFAEVPAPAIPDGATVDSDGCVWSAHWGAGQVVRYAPNGRVDRAVRLPTRQPTCVAFGGPDLDLLFVTSAREGLADSVLAREPMAGHVFIFETPHTGLIEPRYRGCTAENPCVGRHVTT